MEILYYEQIAADLNHIEPERLFEDTRNEYVVYARQICMTYRKEHFKITLALAGERYGKDHATVLHAKKCIGNYKDTKDIRYDIYLKFLKMCDTFVKNHEEKHIKESREMLNNLFVYMNIKKDKAFVDKHIDQCINRLRTMKLLYE